MRTYALIQIPQIEGKYWRWDLPEGKQLKKVSTIMRAKPPHRNHAAMLEALCQKSEHLMINIGSANKLDDKNPFTAEETEDMMRLALNGYANYDIQPLNDFDDPYEGDRQWAEELFRINPDFTEFVCNNDWVLGILKEKQYKNSKRIFDIIFPNQVLPPEEMVYVNGKYVSATVVRNAMVNDQDWERFVVPKVAEYIKKRGLVERVKKLCGGKNAR